MPPKKKDKGASKKNEQKKKTKSIEDKTFGLKNKNKSKKVQAHITSVTKSVLNSGDPRQKKLDEARKRQKINAKARKKAMEEERNALFGEAILAVQKKSTTKTKGGISESKGRDHDDKKEKGGQSKAMKMMFQMDAQEMEEMLTSDPNYVRTIEDEVELQRQKKLTELKEKGIKGTPITAETFKIWLDKKRKAKQDKARKLVETELKKKKGGKGLSVLSGRDLFEYKRDLFKDGDENDDDNDGGIKMSASSSLSGLIPETDGSGAMLDAVTEKVQSNLFLDGDDDDLDDLDDD